MTADNSDFSFFHHKNKLNLQYITIKINKYIND